MKSLVKTLARRCLSLSAVVAIVGVAMSGATTFGNSVAQAKALTEFCKTPLYFEAKAGPSAGLEQFIARGPVCGVLLSPAQAEITVGRHSEKTGTGSEAMTHTVKLQLRGSNPAAKIAGRDQLAAKANYFVGNEPSAWRSGVPLFAKVEVDEVYPGVRLVYYANQSAQLEYDFLVEPGARSEQISFHVEGADDVHVDAAGDLVLKIGGEEIRQQKPVVYQDTGGARKEIQASYHLNKDGTIGFALARYDRNLPLVIDPVLDFLVYMGGKKLDIGWAIALDPVTTNIYIAGETLNKGLPTTPGVFSNAFAGGTPFYGDAFVASYDNLGNLRFLTYLGGKRDDGALAIAMDPTDGVWLTGFTDSTNFPLVNPIRSKLTGRNNNVLHLFPVDAFITHLDSTGANLLYSTYFGGDGRDEGVGIAVDGGGEIFVAGFTESTNLPVTQGAFQPQLAGVADVFVTKLVLGGSQVGFTTYLGGTNTDYGFSVAVDSAGSAWVTGFTDSTNFPIVGVDALTNQTAFTNHIFSELNAQTNSPKHNTSLNSDAFVAEISNDGSALLFSVFLGGTNNDVGTHIAVDGSDNAFVTGYTFSAGFPTNVVTIPLYNDSPTNQIVFLDAAKTFVSHPFVTEIANNHTIVYSTQFGGARSDQAMGIALDNSGNAYVVGSTTSTNFFPTNAIVVTNGFSDIPRTNKNGVITGTNHVANGFATNNPVFTSLSNTNFSVSLKRKGNTNDIFVAVLSPGGSNFLRSIVLGGPGNDQGNGIAVDSGGSAVYIVGSTTSSTNFATTNTVPSPSFGGGKASDAFVGKIQLVP